MTRAEKVERRWAKRALARVFKDFYSTRKKRKAYMRELAKSVEHPIRWYRGMASRKSYDREWI